MNWLNAGLIILVVNLGIAGCEARIADESTPAQAYTECQDPRPQICTRENVPVCATRDTGIRCVTTPCPSTERRNYGNACLACLDTDVMWYEPGVCTDTGDVR